MLTLVKPTRIKVPSVEFGGFAARGLVVSPYYLRAWGTHKTTMILKCFITGYSNGNQVQLKLIASDNSINTTVGMPLTIVYSDTDAIIRGEIETLISNYCTGFFGIQAPDVFVWDFTTPTDLLAAIPPAPLSYQTIVSQTGTAAPVVGTGFTPMSTYAVGTTFTWARTGAGVYTLTASTAVFNTSGKTSVFISPLTNLNAQARGVVTSSTVLTFTTAVASVAVLGLLGLTTTPTDVLFSNTMIYVQTYS